MPENNTLPRLGAHMSIAGGYYKALDAAGKLGMQTCQIFTKNNNQWRAKEITDDDVDRFQKSLAEHQITHPLSHSSYLINLASPKADLRQKSIDAFVVELERAALLGVPYVVLHPGSYTTSSEAEGLQAIISAFDEIHARTDGIASSCLLENTAGQGSNLGWRFEQLQTLIEGVAASERLGVCIDTCHAFAAGYPLAEKDDYEETIRQLETCVGIDRVKAIHLNDSKREFGSRVDRHEHIGEGHLGLEPFRHLMNDSRLAQIPMYLETPKGTRDDQDLDAINLQTLRGLQSNAPATA